ncbi:hypothetical protein [Ekhidna lutea]|nr:hypothetical protein [Ekhidna lutea]
MNNRIKHFGSLIRRKRLADNRLLKMPIGKNSKIASKTYLSEEEKLKLSRKYLEYYRKDRQRSIRIAMVSILLTAILVAAIVYGFMFLI